MSIDLLAPRYSDFVDRLNDNLDKKFVFTVRVTWDKYDDPEYILFNIKEVIARDKNDAEQKAKELFADEIMGNWRNNLSEMKYLTAYVINYLNAPLYINQSPK